MGPRGACSSSGCGACGPGSTTWPATRSWSSRLEGGADATLLNGADETALRAYLNGENIRYTQGLATGVVQTLLKASVPPEARDKGGKSAIDHLKRLRTLKGPEATISRGTASKLLKLLTRRRA